MEIGRPIIDPAADAPPPSGSAELLEGWRSVVVSFISSRLLIVVIIVLSQMIFVPGKWGQPTGVLRVLTNWDGAWYLGIAEKGYEFRPGVESNVGFFPVYPLLIRAASVFIGEPKMAAVVISNAFLLLAGLMLNALIRAESRDPAVSRNAVNLLMFSPVSFFFSSAYTESTFLLLSLGAFLAAIRGQWLAACLCGMALSATRNVGLLIALPLFVEFVRQRLAVERSLRAVLTPRILLFALVPLGLLSFMLFAKLKFNDPLAYAHATAAWGRKLATPWQTLANSRTLPLFHLWVYASLLAAAIFLWIIGIVMKLRPSYLVWAGVLLVVYLCSNSLEAIPRYLSVVFPLFIVPAMLTRRFPSIDDVVFSASVVLLTMCTALTANGYWMT